MGSTAVAQGPNTFSGMDESRPGKTTFLIMVSSLPDKDVTSSNQHPQRLLVLSIPSSLSLCTVLCTNSYLVGSILGVTP